jgi:hypothetical protein
MPAMSDTVDIGRVALVGFVGAVLIYCAVVLVRVLYLDLHAAETFEKGAAEPPRARQRYQAEQEAKLRAQPLTIEVAGGLVLDELRAKRASEGGRRDATP